MRLPGKSFTNDPLSSPNLSTGLSYIHLDHQELYPLSSFQFLTEKFHEVEGGWLDIVRVAVYRETGYKAASGYIAGS